MIVLKNVLSTGTIQLGVVFVLKAIANELDARNYAGFWRRFVAYMIDGFILGVPMAFALVNPNLYKTVKGITIFGFKERRFDAIGPISWVLGSHPSNYFKYVLILSILFFIIHILYFGLCTSSKLQGTIGKRILGLKVVGVDGKRISLGRAIGRYFASVFSYFMCMGFIMAVFTEKKQTLHDYMASTFVVKQY